MSETMPDSSLPALPTNPDPAPPPVAAAPAPAQPAAPPAAPVAPAPAAPPAAPAPGAPAEPAPVAPAAPAAVPVTGPPPAPTMVVDLPEWLREPAAPATPAAPVVTAPAPPPVTGGVVIAPVVTPPAVSALAQELALELMGPADAEATEEQRTALTAATAGLASKLQQLVRQEASERATSVYDERAEAVQRVMEVQTRSMAAQESFRTSLYGSLPAFAAFKGSYVEREILAPEAVAELRRHGVQDEAGLAALDKASFEAITRNIITRVAFRFGANAETLAEHAAWIAANPGAAPAAAAAPAAGVPAAPAIPVTTVPVGGSAGAVPAPPRVAATGGFVPVGGVTPRTPPLDAEGQRVADLRAYMKDSEGV